MTLRAKRKTKKTYLPITASALLVFLSPVGVEADELDDLIDQVRQEAGRAVGASRLGAGYAQMINVSAAPDVAAAIYSIDAEGKDPELNVFKLPLRHVLPLEDRDWAPFVQATFGYLDLKADFDFEPEVFPGEKIKSDWKSYSGSLGGGIEIPFGAHFRFVPFLDVGVARLENDANYRGVISENILQPALKGELFDWNTNALLVQGGLGLDYGRDVNDFGIDLKLRYTHSYIDTFGESKDFDGFSEHADTITTKLDISHPLGVEASGYPLLWIGHLGNTTFLGSNRDALGFSDFYEVGFSIGADVSKNDWPVQRLSLGAMAIFGEDVRGWSILFGYRF